MATNGNLSHHDQYKVSADQYATSSTNDAASAGSSSNSLPKDEVGWYFVEQYYTTLSKSPEKLHLFYGKKSQFVAGLEAQISTVVVGRPAIQERIKSLDFQDAKVRVNNVDSQGSGESIIIQVIGEISNNGGEPKKFVQTFVLAQQPSGYFVLNDILRYIKEEDEEETVEEPAVEDATVPETTAATEEVAAPETTAAADIQAEPEEEAKDVTEIDPVVIDQKLEEVSTEAPSDSAVDTPAEPAAEEQAEVPVETLPDPEKVAEEIAEEEVKEPEVPKDPSPTPAAPSRAPAPAPAPAEPEKPKGPPKPMTWASRAAAAAGPRPPVALPKPATPAVPQPRAQVAAPAAQPAAPTPAPANKAPETAATPTSAKDSGSEWETAQTKRQNRPQSISASAAEKESPAAYIKNVTEKISTEQLRSELSKYGELAYFDINRQKNCAFVEFATQTGYNAAVAANPHTIDGESIYVEQRRPKATAYGGSSYGSSRGGMPGRGRGGYDGGRGGNQGSVRGTYQGQTRGGRGGGSTRGGRGASQAGNA